MKPRRKCGLRAAGLLLSGLLAATSSLTAAPPDEKPSASGYQVTVVESHEVPLAENPQVSSRQLVLRVSRKGEASTRQLVFGGPAHFVDGDLKTLQVVGDHLLVTTENAVAAFDLASGKETFFDFAEPEITPTPDGERVAYKLLQPRFLPPEASTTIVKVLDVKTAKDRPVFPEPSAIRSSQGGQLLAWEDNPAKRYSVLSLFWSPDASRLVFFAKQGPFGAKSPDEVKDFVGVVDLSKGLAASRYALRLIAPEEYLRSGADLSGRIYLFGADAISWLSSGTVRVTPPPDYRWLKDDITLKLPEVE